MPVNTVQQYLKTVLNGQLLPNDLGTLEALITPPNPNDDAVNVTAYIWGSRADEGRRSVPRAQFGNAETGGWKVISHEVDIWLVWFGAADDPDADQQFPTIIDATTAVLRNVVLLDQTQYAVDPVTGQKSNLLNVGENLNWEYAPVKATVDQRYLRYDARITCSLEEWFQA